MTASDDLRVALRPFAAYQQLGQAPPPTLRAALLGPLGWLLFVACCVSWTTSGALLLEHLVFGPVVWCFAPFVQGGWTTIVARRFGERSAARVLGLYFRGHLPWLLLLALTAGVCLIAPDPWPVFRWLLASGLILLLALGASVWCGVLTYAMFRSGLGWSRRQSGLATVAHYGGCIVIFSGWFLVTGQLLPLWGIM